MFHGNWAGMTHQHPFAPYFACWTILLSGAVFLSSTARQRWIEFWIRLEQKTRLHATALTFFTMFGIARLLWSIAHPG